MKASFSCQKISDSDISIVIQGEATVFLPEIIAAFKRILPNAEIILSTWINSTTPAWGVDKIVYNQDPKSFVQNRKIKGDGHYNNVNRQTVSALAGLRAASSKYSLKTRTDVFVENSEWLSYFGKYDAQALPSIFKSRVLVCDYYCRNPRVFPLPFHWSDWVFFGETTDLIEIFDIPLMAGDDINWFELKPHKCMLYRDNINRYLPEQWICSSFLRKYIQLRFDCFYDATHENIKLTERFFAENLVILDSNQWGIRFVKYNPNRYMDNQTLIHNEDWNILYRKYCLKDSHSLWLFYLARCSCKRLIHYFIRPILMTFLGHIGVKEIIRTLIKTLNRRRIKESK